jgi:hypothetical protein
MKTVSFKSTGLVLLLAATLFNAGCKSNDDENPASPPYGAYDLGDGSTDYEIRENVTLTSPNVYHLKGFVYVTAGATLTIEPGVVVKGEKSTKATLIVERGGRLIAQGTPDRPIVFTSGQAPGNRRPGDWGGIIFLGKARNNLGEQTIEGGVRSKHGGMDDADNSGVLSYVRCEFAGVEYSVDNEINALTFGSVGSATKVDHVQVSFSGDDAFEWFGGTVNAKYLVAFRTWDDDFDTDNGFGGKIQYALGIRDPGIGDKSASNGFESDNNADGAPIEPFTAATFANVSLFGPVADPSTYINEAGVDGSAVDARFQAALHLRRHTRLGIFNSLLAAFPIGVIIENNGKGDAQGNATAGYLNIGNCVVAGAVKNFQDKQFWTSGSIIDPATNSDAFVSAYIARQDGGNKVFATLSDLHLSGADAPVRDLSSPNVFLTADSPLKTGASWANGRLSSWFDHVDYIGAFAPDESSANSWMTGWTNFDPQHAVY